MKGDFYTINFYLAGREFTRWTNLTPKQKQKEEDERNDIGV